MHLWKVLGTSLTNSLLQSTDTYMNSRVSAEPQSRQCSAVLSSTSFSPCTYPYPYAS